MRADADDDVLLKKCGETVWVEKMINPAAGV
jgi:hypothetical protein